jgi:hypothetical protein
VTLFALGSLAEDALSSVDRRLIDAEERERAESRDTFATISVNVSLCSRSNSINSGEKFPIQPLKS